MKKKFLSLSFKQILSIVIPLAIIAIYATFSTLFILNMVLEQNVAEKAQWANDQVQYETKIAFETPSIGVNSLADSIKNDPSTENISSLLKVFANNYPQCVEFFFGRNGQKSFITNDDWVAPKDFDYANSQWYTGARDAKNTIFAAVVEHSHKDNNRSIIFSRAVYDKQNRFIGVVGTELPFAKLAEIVSSVSVSPNSKSFLVDDVERFLAQDTGVNFKKIDKADFFDGTNKSFVKDDDFFAVQLLNGSPWFLVTCGPMSDFTGEIQKWILVIVLVIIALILANLVYNAYILNRTNEKEHKIGEQLLAETQNLAVSSKETAATAQDQSAAVKEIVATMEDNTALSEDISQKIKDVSGVANKTSSDVSEGVSYLEENVRQLHEIAVANQTTIDGIKLLDEKIENIWDIVTLINSVADQAKIIAFNAELEASSAGEAGRNFHIVATEIRRLADGIIDGTKEIKEKINEIQQSSDSLILASESGTEKIKAGVDNAKNLEERFGSIKNASEITATSAGDITTIIQQQALASEQILVTLKQIASGVENFTMATEHISLASQNLKKIAEDLSTRKTEENT